MPVKIAMFIAFLLQLSAALIAISLIKRTRTNVAWWLISIGFLLMAIQRLFEFLNVLESGNILVNVLFSSWIAVFISIAMLVSLIFIKRIFNIQKRIDDLRKQNESRILSAIIKTEENERQRFAKELHDGLGPILSSVKMAVSALSRNPKDDANLNIIYNTDKLIDESIETIKEISNKLSPHVLNNFGLLKAVKSFISKLQLTGDIDFKINSNLNNQRFNYNLEVVFYRVICELLTNTLKHASAKKIEIDLTLTNKMLKLIYFDDGIGLNLENIQYEQKGMGYSNIQSRIKSLNGSFEVFSNPSEGVKIIITANIA